MGVDVLRRRSLAAFCAVLISLLLGGCQTLGNAQRLEAGPGLDFDPAEVKQHAQDQARVLDQLYVLADITPPLANGADWDPVVAAGIDFANRKCEAYMHALFRLNRDRRTVVSQIDLLGTAVAGLMAAAESAAKEVAAAAIAFGLASSSVDNLSSNLLYDLDPSSVRSMVKALQKNYWDSLGTGYRSRTAAMSAIRNYALLCVPANIEAEVNLSVKKAQPEVAPGDPGKGRPPTVTNAVLTTTSDRAFENDDASERLRNFVFRGGGTADVGARARLEAYLAARGISASVASFINGAGFAQERARAAAFFQLPR